MIGELVTGFVAPHHDITEIVHVGELMMPEITYMRGYDFRRRATCEKQKFIHLVAG